MRLKFLALAGTIPLTWVLSVGAQDILDHWHLRDSRPLTRVRFLNGQFVGVGTNGTILTSPDGRVWTARNSGTMNNLYAVTWGYGSPSFFVAVGGAGTIVRSSDAVNWMVVTTPYSCALNDVTHENGIGNFIAATTASTTNTPNFLISGYGDIWSGVFVPGAQSPFSSSYRMVAVFGSLGADIAAGGGYLDDFWQSLDGGWTWTNRGNSDQMVNGITFANGRMVVVGWEGRPAISTNYGDSWFSSYDTNVCLPPPANCYFGSDITYGASSFVAVRSYYGWVQNKGLVTSSDGVTWTNRSGLTGLEIDTIAYGNGTFVAAGGTGIYRAEVAPPLLSAQLLPDSNAIHLTISGEVGRTYRLQGSTNFSSWADVGSFTNNGPPSEFVEPLDPSSLARFYRIVSP